MTSRFFKLLAGHLDGLESRLGAQPEIDAIRAAMPKLGRPKGSLGKRTKEVEEIVRKWSERDCYFPKYGALWETDIHKLAEHCRVSVGTIRSILKRLRLPWRSFQGSNERKKKPLVGNKG